MPPMQLLDPESIKISSSSEWWERRTNLERRLVIATGFLSIFVLALVITVAVLATPSSESDESKSSSYSYLNSENEQILASSHQSSTKTSRKTTSTSTTTTALPERETLPKCITEEPTTEAPLKSTTESIKTTTESLLTTLGNSGIFSDTIFEKEDICDTEACVAAAYSLLSSIDDSVNPCDDFYQYSCGKWIAENVLPNATDSILTNRQVSHRIILTKDVLNQPMPSDTHIFKSNVINFYKACMNLPAIEKLGSKPLIDYITQHSAWTFDTLWNPSKFNWVLAVADLDFDVLMWVDIKPDPDNPEKNIIYLQPGSLGAFWTPVEYSHSLTQNIEHAKAYMTFMSEIAHALEANSSHLATDMKNVALFEAKLANITLERDGSHIRDNPVYNRTTIRDLALAIPEIDWIRYFDNIFPNNIFITESEEILVNRYEFFPALIKLIAQTNVTSTKTIPNYILIRVAMTYAFDLSSEFHLAYSKFSQHVLKVNSEKLRWNLCLDLTVGEFPNTIGALYVAKYFPKESFQLSHQILYNITGAYKKILNDSIWLDENTKNAAINKIDALIQRSIIGYLPQSIDDAFLISAHEDIKEMRSDTHFQNRVNLLHNDRDIFLKSLREPVRLNVAKGGATDDTPVYSLEDNILYVYAGALQRPKFDKDFPKSFNYAGIGSEIAYLMTMGIDNVGRFYNNRGKKVMWGENHTFDIYEEKAQCFVEQFDKYSIPELGQNVNGTQTLESNIAQTVGVKVAFKAFMEAVKTAGYDPRLPGLKNFTTEQQFFLNFAQIYCGGSNSLSQKRLLMQDQSPDTHRVNGVVSNFQEFASAFKCPLNSPMNPSKKCSIWE